MTNAYDTIIDSRMNRERKINVLQYGFTELNEILNLFNLLGYPVKN